MAVFKSFRAFRPINEHASDIPSDSTEFGSAEDLRREFVRNPNNYLYLTKCHLGEPQLEAGSPNYLKRSREFVDRLMDEGSIKRDNKECYYIYRQFINDVPYTGLIGLVDLHEYHEGKIKKHERTRSAREFFISRLVESVKVIGQPVLMSYYHHEKLEDFVLRRAEQTTPDQEFIKLGKLHQLWCVSDEEGKLLIQNALAERDSIYIMDGHHRIASTASLYNYHQDESHRYLISYLLDSAQLHVDPFHRMITGVSIDKEELMVELGKVFHVEEHRTDDLHPTRKGEFVLCCSFGRYNLTYKKLPEDDSLDVLIAEEHLVKNVFGIEDSSHDPKIDFINGDHGLSQAQELCKAEGNYLICLHPCTFEEIARIADNNEIMPPKSTYVEPKALAGLAIQLYGRGEKS